jgi:hypothetical protein
MPPPRCVPGYLPTSGMSCLLLMKAVRAQRLPPCLRTVAQTRAHAMRWERFGPKFRVLVVGCGFHSGCWVFFGSPIMSMVPRCDVLGFKVPMRLFSRVDDYWHGYKLFCYAYYSNSVAHEAEFRHSKLGALQSSLPVYFCFLSLHSGFELRVCNCCLGGWCDAPALLHAG